ncbi:hypothetical protein STEG23_031212, partial [Scotinomys teguina]
VIAVRGTEPCIAAKNVRMCVIGWDACVRSCTINLSHCGKSGIERRGSWRCLTLRSEERFPTRWSEE